MWRYTVTWCLLLTVITTCPVSFTIDEFGRTISPPLSCATLTTEQILFCNNSKEFINRFEAFKFYCKGKSEIGVNKGFVQLGKVIHSINIDSAYMKPKTDSIKLKK